MPRRTEGSLVEIALGGGLKAYARVLSDPLFAFYDIAEKPADPKTLGDKQPIFKVWVMRRAVTSGRWPVVAKWPLETELMRPASFFKQDLISDRLSIYSEGNERPANIEECVGLEPAAIWSAEHIEDRLRDHIAGVPNRWVESLKIKADRINEATGAKFG